MEYKKLGDIADIKAGGTPSRNNMMYWNEGHIPWLKISDLNGRYVKDSTEYITTLGLNNSSAKLLEKGTIVYTIFATLGEVAILEIDATTNQAIVGIQIHSNNILKEYLYYYLKSIKRTVLDSGRGLAQNNINLSILRNFEIPVPPFQNQKKIVEALDKAQSLIDARKEQIKLLDDLIQSTYYDMFGDPVTNPKGWDVNNLEEVGELKRGKSKHRPRNAPELLGGKYPLVQTGDISKAGLYINKYSQTYSELGLKQSKMWSKGTLCITIAANIAKTTILNFDACFPDSVVAFLPSNKVDNMYIQLWFGFLQKNIEASAPESAQKNINLKILNSLYIPVPPIELQNQFAEIVQKIESQKQLMEKSLEEMENNYNGLMQRAFKGELFS